LPNNKIPSENFLTWLVGFTFTFFYIAYAI
jgi:hypothetical protein